MNDSLWTFVFEIANFVALAAALAWLFFKPVRKALADQRDRVRQFEEDAAQKLAEAESTRRDIESQRDALTRELESMRTETREVAKEEAAQILTEARAQVERERVALKRQALHIEKAQTARLAKAVATATRSTMKRFLQQMKGPELEETLIKAACRELESLSDDALAPVTIESATPLGDKVRQLINAALGDASESAEFRVLPDLEGGLRIVTAHGLIDASVTGLASFAEHSLSTEMESIIREDIES